jgi:adenylyltransferase/sulfurtransferase
LGVADFDTVAASNLNRQILHDTDDIGRYKTDSATERIRRLNPNIKVIVHNVRLTIDLITEVIGAYDLIIDATDNFTSRYLISDCCYFLKKPLIEGAAVGYDGILMTIIPDKTPCYRCLYPLPPEDGALPSCSDTGILGMTAGIIGTAQALEALKFIVGVGETASGRILTFDALKTTIRAVPWSKRPDCPLCGEKPSINELVEYRIKCKSKEIFNQ